MEPLSTKDRSKKLFKIIGSKSNLIALINEAIDDNELQWAAELGQIGVINFPNDFEIKNLYAKSLEELSIEETNPLSTAVKNSLKNSIERSLFPPPKFTRKDDRGSLSEIAFTVSVAVSLLIYGVGRIQLQIKSMRLLE